MYIFKYLFLLSIIQYSICFEIPLSISNGTTPKNPIVTIPYGPDIKSVILNSEQSGNITFISNILLTIPIEAGTPGQTFNVLFDTGSPLLWLASESCYSTTIEHKLITYQSSSYEDLKTPFSLTYGSGSVEGYLGSETVSLFGNRMSKHRFLLATSATFGVRGADGIYGFGRTYPNSWNNFNILNLLTKYSFIKNKKFSVYVNQTEEERPKLYLDEIPSNLTNGKTIAECKFRDKDQNGSDYQTFWTCNMSHIVLVTNEASNFQDEAVFINNTSVFDTGTNFILFPISFLAKIQDKIPTEAQCEKIPNIYTTYIICNNPSAFGKIGFVFNGYDLTFEPKDLFRVQEISPGKKVNLLSIVFGTQNTFPLFGMPLFQKYINIFDYSNSKMQFVSYGSVDTIVNVTKYTSDGDIDSNDNYLLIIVLCFVFAVILILIIVGIVIVIKKKQANAIPSNAYQNLGVQPILPAINGTY